MSREVSPFLRLASTPVADLLLPLLKLPPVKLGAMGGIEILRRSGTDIGRDAEELSRVLDALPDVAARGAFSRTLRSVVDWRGQVVTMLDRSYLAEAMPVLLVWGAHDAVIPVAHAQIAHDAMPGSRLELFADAGHFPHHQDPERFVEVLLDFVDTTEATTFDRTRWRRLLRDGRDGYLRYLPRVVPLLADALDAEPLLWPIRAHLNAMLPNWRNPPPDDPSGLRARVASLSAAS